jgi:hypothetical protein
VPSPIVGPLHSPAVCIGPSAQKARLGMTNMNFKINQTVLA